MIGQARIMMAQGRSIAGKRVQGVNDNTSKSHYHNYFELYYLEEGERFHITQDRLYCIHPGEPLTSSPYVMYHSYGQENVSFKRLLVYFSREEMGSVQLLKVLEKGIRVYGSGQRKKQVVHRMLDGLLKKQDDPQAYYEDYIHTLSSMALLTIVRNIQTPVKPEKHNRITDVTNYIHQSYQKDISIGQLTQISYMSPYYLCREFKRYTNSIIIQYMNVTWVANAQRMLTGTNKNITGISRNAESSNVTYFNRVLKSVMGTTPSNFRKMYKTGAGHGRRTI